MRKPTIAGAIVPEQLPGLLKPPFKPVYAVVGPEAFLRERVVTRLRDAFLKGEDPATAFVVFHGPRSQKESSDLSLATVLDEAEAPSLFGSRKLVVVRRCDAFVRLHADALARGIRRIPANCALVLDGDRIGGRKPREAGKGAEGSDAQEPEGRGGQQSARGLLDVLRKHGAIVECQTPYSTLFGSDQVSARSDLGRYVGELGRERGLRLADEAVVALIEIAGDRLSILDGELAKIASRIHGPGGEKAAAAPPAAVSAELVRDMCADAHQLQIFALTDAVMARRRSDSLEALDRVLSLGAADYGTPGKVIRNDQTLAIMFLGSLFRMLARLEGGRARLDAGEGVAAAGKAMQARMGREETVGRTASLWGRDDIFAGYERLLRADLSLKLSQGTPREILERLVFDLCPSATARR